MEVTIEGLDELKRRLDTKRFAAASKVSIGRVANVVKIATTPYPPAGPWCQPGAYPHKWYQRLWGPAWALKAGGTHSREANRAVVGGPMQQSWYALTLDAWSAKVANKATYAPWVKGVDQAAAHAAHGWKTLEEDARGLAQRGVFTGIYAEEIDKVLGGKL